RPKDLPCRATERDAAAEDETDENGPRGGLGRFAAHDEEGGRRREPREQEPGASDAARGSAREHPCVDGRSANGQEHEHRGSRSEHDEKKPEWNAESVERERFPS